MFHQTVDKLPCQSIQGAFKDSITLSRVESVRALVAFLLIAESVSVIHEINPLYSSSPCCESGELAIDLDLPPAAYLQSYETASVISLGTDSLGHSSD
ncbi:unnamed protein product [Arctogadus glacialis]